MAAENLLHDPRPKEDRRIGNVEVRPAELGVLIDGRRASLTVREFQIFFVLFERFDRVVLRGEIYELVWGARMPRRDRSVDVFVRKVRSKLAAVDPDRVYIHTHFGIGYRFHPEPGPDAEPAPVAPPAS
jgi:DNA-binding response OmpR family regulator